MDDGQKDTGGDSEWRDQCRRWTGERSIATGLGRKPVGYCYSVEMRRPAIRSTAHDPTLSYPTYQPGLSASYPRCQPPDFCYQLCTPKGVHNNCVILSQSMVTGRLSRNLKLVMFKLIARIEILSISWWFFPGESHHLSQCWPTPLSPYGVTGPQWVLYKGTFNYVYWIATTNIVSNWESCIPGTTQLLYTKHAHICMVKSITLVCCWRNGISPSHRKTLQHKKQYLILSA